MSATRTAPVARPPAPAQPLYRPRVARVATSISLNLILRRQMRVLDDEGFDVVCVCDPDEWTPALREAGFAVWPLGMGRRPSPLRALAWGVRLNRRLRHERVEIVHTHNAFHGIVGRVAARLAGVPVVVQTVHNWWYLDAGGPLRSRLYRLLERLAARLSDAVLFINRDDLERAGLERIVPDGRRYLIGNGIDIGAFTRAWKAADRAALRRSLAIGPAELVVAMVARLEPPKDHALFLDAFERLLERVPRARALLVGYGLERGAIEGDVRRRGLEERVSFLGFRDDVPAVLKACDVLALASRQEGFGRCLVEGMAAQLPVVATDVVGVRDVVQDGRTGLLVPSGDARAFGDALLRVATDPLLASRLARAGQADAIERFDERRAALRVARVYRKLLAERSARER